MSALGAVVAMARVVAKGAKAAFVLSKDVYKIAKPVIVFLAKHPTITTAVAAYQVGKNSEDIKDYLIKRKLQKEAIDQITTFAEDKDLAEHTQAISDAAVKAMAADVKAKAKGNHPEWWVADKAISISYMNSESRGWNSNTVLQGIVHRQLWLDASNARQSAADWSYDNVGPLNPSLKDDLYAAYRSYYKRLAEPVPDRTANQLFDDIAAMLNASWLAVCTAFELKRKCDMEEVTLFGSKAHARVLMPIMPEDYYAMNGRNAPQWADTVSHTGWYSNVQDSTQSLVVSATAARRIEFDPTAVGSFEHDLNWVHVSNAVWQRAIARLSNVFVSENAFKMAEYLFSGVFVDDSKEDHYELYSFSAPPSTVFNGMRTPGGSYFASYYTPYAGVEANSPSPWKDPLGLDRLNYLCDIVSAFRNKDKAYDDLLASFGLTSYAKASDAPANTWQSNIQTIFRRDPMAQTLKFFKCDDTFYGALVNAQYRGIVKHNSSEYEFMVLDAHSDSGCWFMGDRKILNNAKEASQLLKKTKSMPSSEKMDAGLFASNVKFNTPYASLWVGPTSYLSASGMPTVQAPNVQTVVYQAVTANKPKAQSSIFANSTGDVKADFLPFNMRIVGACKAGPVPSGNASFVHYYIDPNDTLFDPKTFWEAEGLQSYQWSNMFLPFASISGITEKLAKLDLAFGLM